ncbi:hypothetical protein ACJX0J_030425, partial [Zea mays]
HQIKTMESDSQEEKGQSSRFIEKDRDGWMDGWKEKTSRDELGSQGVWHNNIEEGGGD